MYMQQNTKRDLKPHNSTWKVMPIQSQKGFSFGE